MSRPLISRNPDLKRLRDEGYEVSVQADHLVVSHVPYVNEQKVICYGALVSKLTLAGDKTIKPETHVVGFTGSAPCSKDGVVIAQIVHAADPRQITADLRVQRTFSNKPKEGYPDYYALMRQYILIISSPAKAIDDSVTAQTYAVVESEDLESPFQYLDTNSSRAEITAQSRKFSGTKIVIIGLGGTGAYILDLVAKTPVASIHLFDGDDFIQHNAFRAPGAPSREELEAHPKKVHYLAAIYGKMHKGIVPHAYYLTPDHVGELEGAHFVFLAVDDGAAKKPIIAYLEQMKIPFVDVGMGIRQVDEQLIGVVRTTLSTPEHRDSVHKHVSFAEPQDDAYATNVQIAELNAFNATLAVIAWKKYLGFYGDHIRECNSTYTIDCQMLLREDERAP